MASVCSFQTSYAQISASPAFAKCAANRLPTAPQPTITILIRKTLFVECCLPGCGFPRSLSSEKAPGNVGETFAFRFADAIRVLGVQANFAIAIDDLRVKGEDHVFFERHLALGADRRIFEHGRANGVPRKMSEREAVLGESIGNRPMHIAGQFSSAHEFPGSFQGC